MYTAADRVAEEHDREDEPRGRRPDRAARRCRRCSRPCCARSHSTTAAVRQYEMKVNITLPTIITRLVVGPRRRGRSEALSPEDMVQTQVTAQGWRGSTPEGRRPQIARARARGWLAVASSTPATPPLLSPAKIRELNHA